MRAMKGRDTTPGKKSEQYVPFSSLLTLELSGVPNVKRSLKVP